MSKTKFWTAVGVGVALLAGAVGAILAYKSGDAALRDVMEFSGAVLGGAGVIFGAFYGFLVAAESAAEARRRRSLEIIDQLNQPNVVRLRFTLEAAVEGAKDPYARLTGDADLKADAYFFLGLLEDVALTVRCHVADEQVLYDSLSYMLPTTAKLFKDFIQGTRRRHDDNSLFAEIELLAECWEKHTSYRTGRKQLCATPKAPR